MKIDLHLHSTASDGSDTPSELVKKAAMLKLGVIALTDHDTVDGVAEAAEAGKKEGVYVIPGVELSAFSSYEVHILGYNIDIKDAAFCEKLSDLKQKRIDRALEILEKLRKHNIVLDSDELIKSGSVGRPHIAAMLLRGGYVRSIQEAFERYVGKNGLAFVPSHRLSPLAAVSMIKDAGGIPVLAHPLVFVNKGVLDALVSGLKPYGLGGIEAYYPSHSSADSLNLLNVARNYRLIATGGSDYHGVIRPVEMGCPEWQMDRHTAAVLKVSDIVNRR